MSDLFRLDGTVVAVIGAGSGIGEAVARGAAEQGAHVFCLDVAAPAASATAERIRQAHGRADAGAVDVTDGDTLNATLDYTSPARYCSRTAAGWQPTDASRRQACRDI